MTRIKRKRRLIKSKLVNPINVLRWRSSKFLCIRARSLVWPSLKGHRGRIAGILSNKGSLLYILRRFITWQSHWRSNRCSCILCHDLVGLTIKSHWQSPGTPQKTRVQNLHRKHYNIHVWKIREVEFWGTYRNTSYTQIAISHLLVLFTIQCLKKLHR